MQAVSSLPWANNQPRLLWEVSVIMPLRSSCLMALGASCMPLLIQHRVLRSIRRSCSHAIWKSLVKTWALIYLFSGYRISLGGQDCFALIPSRPYLVSISCCDCDLAVGCIKADITSGIPEEAEGPQESTGWRLGGSFHFFLVHIATSIYNLWWQTNREFWEPQLSDLEVVEAS